MKFPVEEIAKELTAPFEEGVVKRVLLKAPTGSGKSTIVPSLLLDDGLEGLVIVIQPRRIAARMLAQRVASLRNVTVGGEVGYIVRFDTKKSESTRILFVTDGIFQNWIERDPELKGVSCVIFDAPCREVEAGGRTFPVEISYQAPELAQQRSGRPVREAIWESCFKVAAKAIQEDDAGHILIFLPGVHEIRKTVSLLESTSHFRHWDIMPLYSALPPKLQDLAVAPSSTPKIIVATNVAETSLTIDGVRTVIDAGLARISEFDPNRGIETLMVQQIAQAAADQRAGRAGRTAPGKCVRLWSHNSHAKRKGKRCRKFYVA